MEKWISIIVPCYNVEKYIERCFASLAAQTIGIEHLEVIMVDDCSVDGTWERLTDIEQSYPESVIIVHCDENGRQGRARNIGIQYVSAPYIGFVDADDWVEPDMFARMYEKIVSQDCDIVMCNSWRDFDRADQVLPPRREEGKKDRLILVDSMEKRKLFLVNGVIEFGVWNKLYRTELIRDNQICFPENLAYEDHYFAMLLYFYVNKVYLIEERFYHYYVNPQSTVLTKNAAHHFDILEVDTQLWDECERRGFLSDYRKELEYQFLCLCYLMSIKMLLLRLGEVPYDFFVHMREEVLKRVPNSHDNIYVDQLVTDLNKIILELLDKPLSEKELKTVLDPLGDYVRRGVLTI